MIAMKRIMELKREGLGWEDVCFRLNITRKDDRKSLRKFYFLLWERDPNEYGTLLHLRSSV